MQYISALIRRLPARIRFKVVRIAGLFAAFGQGLLAILRDDLFADLTAPQGAS